LAVHAYVAVLAPTFSPITGRWPATTSAASDLADVGPGWIRLQGESCPPLRRLTAGQTVDWPVVWRTTGVQPSQGLLLFTQLVDSRDAVLAQDDRLPLGGRYPSASWLPGRQFTETVRLTVPQVDRPHRAMVITGWYRDDDPSDRVDVLPVTGNASGCDAMAGAVMASQEAYGWPVVVAPARPVTVPPGATERGDTFGQPGTAQLAGLAVESGQDAAGQRLATLRLYWMSLAADPSDPTVFVQLLDDAGRPVATADGQPVGGQYPTSLWQTGEIVPDEHRILLPATVPDGRYRLVLGWYNLSSGQRHGARDAEGRAWPDNAAVLGTVVVKGAELRYEP
jgi:hypothetical protein